MKRTHINGVPVDLWGTWCPHGQHIMVANPDDERDYPEPIPADPWPCDVEGCTLKALDAERAREALEYQQEQWAEYNAEIRAGLNTLVEWPNSELDDDFERQERSVREWADGCSHWFR